MQSGTKTNIVEFVNNFFTENSGICSATIVGSASRQSLEVNKTEGDLDVIVLFNHISQYITMLEKLEEELRKNSFKYDVMSLWGIVSNQFLGKKIIHMHATTVDDYMLRSTLFRKSVSKYPAIIGQELSRFVKTNSISPYEFFEDDLGPVMLLERLNDNSVQSEAWLYDHSQFHLAKISNNTASFLDQVLYSILHSSRNLLRQLGANIEFASYRDIPKYWEKINGPEIGLLNELVEVKTKRRSGYKFNEFEENAAIENGMCFLIKIIDYAYKVV